MKTSLSKFASVGLIILATLFIFACDEDDDTAPMPTASFSYEVDAENVSLVKFINDSENGESYAWDFGDGSSSTEESPSHVFPAAGGTFDVSLKVTNSAGSVTESMEVTVAEAPPVNLIMNSGFDDESNWTILNQIATTTGGVTIADGVAKWYGTDGDWTNGYTHYSIHQKVSLEAGTYALDLMATTSDVNDFWFEVWVGKGEPVEGTEYNADNFTGAVSILAMSTWECPDTDINFSGSMAENGCFGRDGTFTVDEAADYYVVIRSGGLEWGTDGATADDVTLFRQ